MQNKLPLAELAKFEYVVAIRSSNQSPLLFGFK